MHGSDLVLLAVYYTALVMLAIFGVHRFHLVLLRRRFPDSASARQPVTRWPSVTVQLPVFNEANVVVRLLDAVAALEYPGLLDIQLLDDSTDLTSSLAAERIHHYRERGLRLTHIRRSSRDGFKAGALANGMRLSESECFAIFDADFVPPPATLTRLVPILLEDGVGMVQARWGHLNASESVLTRAQAIFLDAHFTVESAARCLDGRFFNFNGTAGIWRREAIEGAGGWSAFTLTEDLDLSYRSQLAGWRFRFADDVVVPAELPAALSGFQDQQHRWAKGSIQTARKLLPAIASRPLPFRVKAEAFFHLTNNAAYVFTLVVALLLVPSITIRLSSGSSWTLLADTFLFGCSTGSVAIFYLEGQSRAGGGRRSLAGYLSVIPIGAGLSVRNASAVVEGLFTRGGFFTRTPKRGGMGAGGSSGLPRLPWGELALSCYYSAAVAAFAVDRQWAYLPFLVLFLSGFAYISAMGVVERINHALGRPLAGVPRNAPVT